jgi:blocked-early-in-transport protein 1
VYRFPPSSNLHQRSANPSDPRAALFDNYRSSSQTRSSPSPARPAGSSRFQTSGGSGTASPFAPADGGSNISSSYPQSSSGGGAGYSSNGGLANPYGNHQLRTGSPNPRGQYSDAVLSSLESQNDDDISQMSQKVRMLKDITLKIGDEIRDSTKLAENMNDSFESARRRVRGTMMRMRVMAERTGVGWKVWLLFFLAVTLLFWYVRFV